MRFSLATAAALASSASATIYYAGVAESGGEFGVYSSTATNGTGLPGRFGVDYAFLNASTVPIWVKQNKVPSFKVQTVIAEH
jgi:endoglucanase